MDDVEAKMVQLAQERYGTSDLSTLAPGLLELLEKEVNGRVD